MSLELITQLKCCEVFYYSRALYMITLYIFFFLFSTLTKVEKSKKNNARSVRILKLTVDFEQFSVKFSTTVMTFLISSTAEIQTFSSD